MGTDCLPRLSLGGPGCSGEPLGGFPLGFREVVGSMARCTMPESFHLGVSPTATRGPEAQAWRPVWPLFPTRRRPRGVLE